MLLKKNSQRAGCTLTRAPIKVFLNIFRQLRVPERWWWDSFPLLVGTLRCYMSLSPLRTGWKEPDSYGQCGTESK